MDVLPGNGIRSRYVILILIFTLVVLVVSSSYTYGQVSGNNGNTIATNGNSLNGAGSPASPAGMPGQISDNHPGSGKHCSCCPCCSCSDCGYCHGSVRMNIKCKGECKCCKGCHCQEPASVFSIVKHGEQ